MSKKNRYKRTHQFTPYTKADGAAVSDEFDAIQAVLDLIPELRDDGKGFAASPVIPDPTDPNHPVPYRMLTETEKSVNNARDEVLEKAQQVAKNTETVATNTKTAINQASSATQSATSAAESSRSADESEDWARKWASNPVNEAVSGDKYSAYHYATQAEQSAQSLSTAADAAENSANIATQKAEEAKTYSDKAASAAIGEIDYNKVRNVPRASTTQDGVTRLTSDTGLDSETLGLTAKAGKFLAQGIAALRLAMSNYIPLKSRSSSVTSNDENGVATPKAVKIAYDKGVEAKSAADAAQTSATQAKSSADAAQRTANDANNNANGRVSKSGDTMNGQLNANSGVNTLARGADGFDRQWQNSIAPYLVNNGNANGNNAYYPFIKGINRNGNTWGTAFSFGYETPDGINKFGKGCIHLIEDNGTQKLWTFEHNGNFNSAGDVRSSGGKSLNNATQLSDFVYQKIGNFEVRKYPDGTMIQTYSIMTEYKRPNNRVAYSFNWAVAFASAPIIFTSTKTSWDNNEVLLNISSDDGGTTNTKTSYWMWENNYQDGVIHLNFIAIGRWK